MMQEERVPKQARQVGAARLWKASTAEAAPSSSFILWPMATAASFTCGAGRPRQAQSAQVDFPPARAASLLCCSSVTSCLAGCLATRQVWMPTIRDGARARVAGPRVTAPLRRRGRARASGRAMKRSAAASFLVVTRSMEMGVGPTPALATAWPQNG